EKAAALAPHDHLAWANLGDALSFTTRQEEARAAFERARALAERKLRVNPRDAGTLIDLAWIEAMLDRRQEAQEALARARGLTPSDPYVHFVGALVALRGGERRSAMPVSRRRSTWATRRSCSRPSRTSSRCGTTPNSRR